MKKEKYVEDNVKKKKNIYINTYYMYKYYAYVCVCVCVYHKKYSIFSFLLFSILFSFILFKLFV